MWRGPVRGGRSAKSSDPQTRRPNAPHGGSDFFNSNCTPDVSATTSGAIVQAVIAINIIKIARVNALTLAAR